MDRCDHYIELLSAQLDGELTEEEERELAEHLAGCLDCRTLETQLAVMHAAFPGLEEISAPEGFAQGVIDQLEHRTSREKKIVPLFRKPQLRALAGLAACAALCIGIYQAGLLNRGPASDGVAASGSSAAGSVELDRAANAPVTYSALPPDTTGAAGSEDKSTPGERLQPPAQQNAVSEFGGSAPAEPDVPRVQESQQEPGNQPSTNPKNIQGTQNTQVTSVPPLNSERNGKHIQYQVGDQRVDAVLTLERLPDGADEVLGTEVEWLAHKEGWSFCVVTGAQMETLMALVERQGQDLTYTFTDQIGSEELCAVMLAPTQQVP